MKGGRKDRVNSQISLMHGENGSAMNNTCNVRTCLLNIFFRLVRLSILLMNSFTKRSEVPLEIDRTPGLSS